MMKLWRYLKRFLWLLADWWKKKKHNKPPDISQIVSQPLLTFSLSHYSKIWLSAHTFSSVFALKNTWSGPFTADIQWINWTSPQVWPSTKIQASAPMSCFAFSPQIPELLILLPSSILGNYTVQHQFLLQWLYMLYFQISMHVNTFLTWKMTSIQKQFALSRLFPSYIFNILFCEMLKKGSRW